MTRSCPGAYWLDQTGLFERETLDHCMHPNVFGCPNHGELARAMVRPLPRVVRGGLEQIPLFTAARENWSSGYTVTRRGHCAAYDLEFEGEAWES